MSNMKIRLVLADHHPAVLSGINHGLAVLPTLEVVGTAADLGDLIKLLDMKPCDVVITGYAMRGGEYGDGMTLPAYLRTGQIPPGIKSGQYETGVSSSALH
ncbi:hypothetical protein PQR02_15000 [Paraburkholderia sediminicola]|uniref:Uncharacterized protein n=1 Tax=Paraburkholderia rhynchosiae TaxID=487049 RepID=A0ACC7NF83_9BURK